MKRNRFVSLFKRTVVCVHILTLAVLAAGVKKAAGDGLDADLCRDFLEGTDYLESAEYQEKAAENMNEALKVAAAVSALEGEVSYDPNGVLEVESYEESQQIYESITDDMASGGLYYRAGDLYNWGLEGFTIKDGILQEIYSPYYWKSLQQYSIERGRFYNAVIAQIERVAKLLTKNAEDYEKYQWKYAEDQTNLRYALWDVDNALLYSNVTALNGVTLTQENLENCFQSYGSYCVYDSRTERAVQVNTGDYPVSDTSALLTEYGAKLGDSYRVYLGIDTSFPVQDELAAGQAAFEEKRQLFEDYYRWMKVAAVIWAVSAFMTAVIVLGLLSRLFRMVSGHAGTAGRILLYFAGYEAVQIAICFFVKNANAELILLIAWNVAVLSALIVDAAQKQRIVEWIGELSTGEKTDGPLKERLFRGNREMAEAVQTLGDGLRTAMREQVKSERMKADLITNVSHDLKTPLTSIINYVDLMKREEIDNPQAREYLNVLDQKSQRLKQLTEDLVEASRASSGAVQLDIQRIDMKELLMQTSGEFEERFQRRGLKLMENYPPAPVFVEADGRSLWRIIENIYRNVEKYAMPNTRVYLDLADKGGWAELSMKNISEQSLNISAEELIERFTRGDVSRSTEGSGLGLSIAKDLTELQQGKFEIYLDGDLFKVTVGFPRVE